MKGYMRKIATDTYGLPMPTKQVFSYGYIQRYSNSRYNTGYDESVWESAKHKSVSVRGIKR